MPLDAVVDTLDSVPEALRDHYKQDGERYKLDVAGVEFPEDVAGLKSALQKEREAAKSAAKRLQDLDGIDVGRYKELLAAEEKREEAEAAKRGEFDKILARNREKWEADLAAERESRSTVEGQLTALIRDNEARKALEGHKADVDLLLPHVLDKVQVIVGDDGQRRTVVRGAEGAPRMNDEGKEMTISELVAEMAQSDRYAAGFPATVKKGGGAAANGAGRASGGSFDPRTATDAEKVAFIGKHGRAKFLEALGATPNT